MRKALVGLFAAGVLVAGPASAGADPGGNETAMENCGAAIQAQIARGVSAGGGPKAGEPGPINCDFFFGGAGSGGVGPP